MPTNLLILKCFIIKSLKQGQKNTNSVKHELCVRIIGCIRLAIGGTFLLAGLSALLQDFNELYGVQSVTIALGFIGFLFIGIDLWLINNRPFLRMN
jgi:hypothetical protein